MRTIGIDALVVGSPAPRLTVERAAAVRSIVGLALSSLLVAVAMAGPGVGSDPVVPMPMHPADFADVALAWGVRLAVACVAWNAACFLLGSRTGASPGPAARDGISRDGELAHR